MNPICKLFVAAGVALPALPALAGDAEAGRAVYQARCMACHSLDHKASARRSGASSGAPRRGPAALPTPTR